jgi:hypothetical protein
VDCAHYIERFSSQELLSYKSLKINIIDMVISVKETTVFSVFHPDAQDLYNTCSDLKKVAYELWDPSFRLNAEVRKLSSLSSRTSLPLI